MKSKFVGILLALAICTVGLSQAPKVDDVQRISAKPFSTVVITGSGFSATSSELQVWFGNVKGVIEASTTSSIRVAVPAQAKLSSVEVINTATKLSGKSGKKFMVNFSGNPFTNSFTNVPSASPGVEIFDHCTCDFDSDGRPDIIGSKKKDGLTNLFLLRNQSTALPNTNNTTLSFAAPVSITLGDPIFNITCGDLNGDGKPDLVGTRGGGIDGSKIFVLQNNSTGVNNFSFGTAVQFNLTSGDALKESAIRDLNGDGKPEIIVTNEKTNIIYIFQNDIDPLVSSTIAANKFTKLEKTVTNNLVPPANTEEAGTLALEVEDFTGDGWPEIVVTPNKNFNNQSLFVFVNPANSTLNFSPPTKLPINGTNNINDLASADFNNDGHLDIVLADKGTSNKAFVLIKNPSALAFTSVNGTTGFSSPSPWGVDVGDMNGDGFADFVIGNRNFLAPQFNVYINNQAATPLFNGTSVVTPKANWFVEVGDFDGDAKPDVALTSTDNNVGFSIDIWKNTNCHKPFIFNDNPLSICNGQIITLETIPINGVVFNWSAGTNTGATSDIGFTDAGTITLTGTGVGGACVVNTTITVNQSAGTAPSKPTITGPTGVCEGSPLSLNTTPVGGSPTYIWTGTNGFTSSTTTLPVSITTSATTANAGDYVLRIKVGNCTSDASDPKSISVVAPSAFTVSSNAGTGGVCVGQPVTLLVASDANYNYEWKRGATIVGGNSASYPIASAAAVDEGSYTVLLSHKTISCSSTSDAFLLNVFTAPVASFTVSPPQVCVGTLVTFNSSTSSIDNTATVEYAWTFGDGATATTASPTHTYTAAVGSVTPSLVINYTGVNNCSDNFSVTPFAVGAATPPTIVADPPVTELCPNKSISVELTVPETFDSYVWSTAQTGTPITVKQPGTYTVQTTSSNGCLGTAQIIFTEKPGCSAGGPDIEVLKAFTPNGDNANDTWRIIGIENLSPDCELNVFDGRGKRVFNTKISALPLEGWNGTAGGSELPAGTYYYVFGCPDGKPVTGSVLIVR